MSDSFSKYETTFFCKFLKFNYSILLFLVICRITVYNISYMVTRIGGLYFSDTAVRCDVFTFNNEDCDALCEGFMRIMETCNRMKPAGQESSRHADGKKSQRSQQAAA